MLNIIFCVLSIVAVFVTFAFLFVMVANSLANEFIAGNVEQIRSFLREHSLALTYGPSHRGEVELWEWSIHNIHDTEPHFLSSRRVKQLLIKLKHGEITAKEAVEYCERYGKNPVKKQSGWDLL